MISMSVDLNGTPLGLITARNIGDGNYEVKYVTPNRVVFSKTIQHDRKYGWHVLFSKAMTEYAELIQGEWEITQEILRKNQYAQPTKKS